MRLIDSLLILKIIIACRNLDLIVYVSLSHKNGYNHSNTRAVYFMLSWLSMQRPRAISRPVLQLNITDNRITDFWFFEQNFFKL